MHPSPAEAALRYLPNAGWVLYASGLVGIQRFLLPSMYAYACVVTLAVALYYLCSKRFPQYNAAMIVSLFLSVDNGGVAYNETPAVIRYAIYAVAAATIMLAFRAHRMRTVLYLCYAGVLALITILHWHDLDTGTLFASFQVAFVAFIVFCDSQRHTATARIDLPLLAGVLIACLIGELGNLAFFHDAPAGDYLNYNSTKSLIVLPLLYVLCNRKSSLVVLVLFALTAYVLLGYQTRMILLALALVLCLYAFRRPALAMLLAIFTVGTSLLYVDALEGYKVIGTMTTALNEFSFSGLSASDFLASLDRGRYVESKLFLERDLFRILFGSGLGSGMHDTLNEFWFHTLYDTAFSARELQSGYFHGFHDVWVDVGLRFGMIFIAIVLLSLIRNVFDVDTTLTTFSMALLVLVMCAFFSAAGLLLIAIVGRALGARRLETSVERSSAVKTPTAAPSGMVA